MSGIDTLFTTIVNRSDKISLSEILTAHPDFARRTVQRWIMQLIKDGKIQVVGKGRARRYFATAKNRKNSVNTIEDFPASIPLSADSSDILEYIQHRLHEGVLARYGLRPSQYQQWLNRISLLVYKPPMFRYRIVPLTILRTFSCTGNGISRLHSQMEFGNERKKFLHLK